MPLEGFSSLNNSIISFILTFQVFAARSLLIWRGWRSLFPPRSCVLAHPCSHLNNPNLPFSKLTAQSWTSHKLCPCQEKLRVHSMFMVGSSFMDIQGLYLQLAHSALVAASPWNLWQIHNPSPHFFPKSCSIARLLIPKPFILEHNLAWKIFGADEQIPFLPPRQPGDETQFSSKIPSLKYCKP